MRAVVQRVKQASVRTEGHYAEIGGGMLVLLGVAKGDGEEEAAWLAKKLAALRIFEDGAGKMNLSLKDVGGKALVVSQFTLLADVSRGRRPGFWPIRGPTARVSSGAAVAMVHSRATRLLCPGMSRETNTGW